MNQSTNETGGTGPSHRGVEIGVAVVMAITGLISVLGSIKVGIGWGAEGPQAGFFPFYVGIAVLIACAVNLMDIFRSDADGAVFADWGQLKQVVFVVIPTTVYVALIPFIGIYVSSALLIALFMMWLGKYPVYIAVAVAIGMPILTFLMFEIWFLVPLPKGPLETFLGY